jgi:hypothetical protein
MQCEAIHMQSMASVKSKGAATLAGNRALGQSLKAK